MTRLLILGDRTEALNLARLADAGPWDVVVDTVTWVHPPEPTTARLCREIDVFAAVRTVLRDPPGFDSR